MSNCAEYQTRPTETEAPHTARLTAISNILFFSSQTSHYHIVIQCSCSAYRKASLVLCMYWGSVGLPNPPHYWPGPLHHSRELRCYPVIKYAFLERLELVWEPSKILYILLLLYLLWGCGQFNFMMECYKR